MTSNVSAFQDNQNLLTDFTNHTTMEDKKNTKHPHTLNDLKKELQVLTQSDALKVTGGKSLEKDKWNSGCGSIIPQ